MKKYFELKIDYDEREEITDFLKEKNLYQPNLLYRAIGIENDSDERIKEILNHGTDRTIDDIEKLILLESEKGVFLYERQNDVNKYRKNPLKPSEHTWLCSEDGIKINLNGIDLDKQPLILVYNPKLVSKCELSEQIYEFNDKKNKQDALLALLSLKYY